MPDTPARQLEPELLDALPAEDPEAIRARRDLRLINWLLGNHRWFHRTLARHAPMLKGGIIELGAGDGTLLRQLRRRNPGVPLAGFDLAPRPGNLPPDIAWHAGNFLEREGPWPGTVLLANLVLHHLDEDTIRALGRRLGGVKMLVIGESHRRPEILRRSRWLNPLVGRVTRHDMAISLRAGFVAGELPLWLGLDQTAWQISETFTRLGACRLQAVRAGSTEQVGR